MKKILSGNCRRLQKILDNTVPAYPHSDLHEEYHLLSISIFLCLQILVSILHFVNNPESLQAPSGIIWQSIPVSKTDHKHALNSYDLSSYKSYIISMLYFSSAFRKQLTSQSGWTEQDSALIFCFWDLVMNPINMGYSEIELPEVSSQHHLVALLLALLSTRLNLGIFRLVFWVWDGPLWPQMCYVLHPDTDKEGRDDKDTSW